MPRIKKRGARSQAITWKQVIINQIRDGKMLPIISNSLHNDMVLGGHRALVTNYAENAGYNFLIQRDMTAITQFLSTMGDTAASDTVVKRNYLDFVKNALFDEAEKRSRPQTLIEDAEEQFDALNFSRLATQLGFPEFGEVDEDPALMLASFDLPIYLTTSYHDFIEAALTEAGKSPRTAVCRWHDRLETLENPLEGDYQPSVEEPLVFHLHGHDSHPESLVLTEDDHLQLMVAISRDSEVIPKRIRQALAESSLMLIGYELSSWDFRSIFWSLIRSRSYQQQSVCTMQLENCSEEEKHFFHRYMERVGCELYWGDTAKYIEEIYEELHA